VNLTLPPLASSNFFAQAVIAAAGGAIGGVVVATFSSITSAWTDSVLPVRQNETVKINRIKKYTLFFIFLPPFLKINL
jgi:hypothetical protein